MPSTFSPNLRFELIAAGEQVGTWGDTTNRNLGTLIEQAVAGTSTISLPDADYTLVAAQGVLDQARSAVLVLGGVLTATRNVIAPSVDKVYVVRNNTTGGQSIVLKTVSGVGVTIPNGRSSLVFCDGTDFFGGLTYIAGPLTADSLSLTTPLPVASGGTGGSSQSAAQSNLGLGSAATLAASVGNAGNTAVQRDGSGNFSAGTITATLNGNASTSNNATNFNGVGPSSYAKADANYDWVLVFTGSVTSVNLQASFGDGTFFVGTLNGGNQGSICFQTAPSPFPVPTYTFSSGVHTSAVAMANTIQVSFGSITTIYKLRKL